MSSYKSVKLRRSANLATKSSLRKDRTTSRQRTAGEGITEADQELELERELPAVEPVILTESALPPPEDHRQRTPTATIATTWTRLADSRSRVRAGLSSLRERAKEAARKRRRLRRDGFYWYELDLEERGWARRTIVSPRALLSVGLILVVSLFVLLIAARAASRAGLPSVRSSSASNADPIIIQHEGYWYSPIPSAPAYAVGVWVSDMSPPASGVEEVYVEVTRAPSGPVVQPVANVPVKISSPNGVAEGVVKTDAGGLAIFTFFYGSVDGSPVYVTATATMNGHAYSATTDFVTS